MSADLLANAIPGDREQLNFDTFDSLLSLAKGPTDGTANRQGLMRFTVLPGFPIKITAQSNTAWWQLVKILDYYGKRAFMFGGNGEGAPMQTTKGHAKDVDGGTEVLIDASSDLRTLGVQFAVYHSDDHVVVPVIKEVVLRKPEGGCDLEYSIATEDGSDRDFNDSSVSIRMIKVSGL